jgi:hypothetical protein
VVVPTTDATGSTNNQPSAVGEGWDLAGGGFIERSYVPCSGDGISTSGDECWKSGGEVLVPWACRTAPLAVGDTEALNHLRAPVEVHQVRKLAQLGKRLVPVRTERPTARSSRLVSILRRLLARHGLVSRSAGSARRRPQRAVSDAAQIPTASR